LEAGIAALDKSVAEATEQRKEENEDFTELMASDSAAKELLKVAINRLNQFYNPKLHKPKAKRELSAGDRIFENMGIFGFELLPHEHQLLNAHPACADKALAGSTAQPL